MTPIAQQVLRLAGQAGAAVNEVLAEQVAAYLGLLAKWNKALNLTGFELNSPSDEAVMRLAVEPLAAVPLISRGITKALDVGSGGGSPALPLKMARPEIQFILVESKSRKCAFLREAVRCLQLERVQVANSRLEDLANADPRPQVELVIARAVRLDGAFWTSVRAVLPPGGQVLLFGTPSSPDPWPQGFAESASRDLPGTATRVRIIERQG